MVSLKCTGGYIRQGVTARYGEHFYRSEMVFLVSELVETSGLLSQKVKID